MIGIILTGHNHFATGLASSIEMVGGKQNNLEMVDFEENMNEEELTERLQAAISALDSCDDIVCCCDLMGGSPFKMAATLSLNKPELRVIYGVNLALMLELVLSRDYVEDVDEFLDRLMIRGRQSMGKYVFEEYQQETAEEGI